MTIRFGRGRRELLPHDRRPAASPWLIAATNFLAVIAVAAALGLADLAQRLDRAGMGRFTIELVDADTPRLEVEAAQLVVRLRREPAVAIVAPVPASEMEALLAPALGPVGLATLPLPVLIDVTLAPGAADSALLTIVRNTPHATLTRAAEGLTPLARLVATLRSLALTIVAMAAGVTMLVAVLAARMALEAHGATLATLHSLGATDRDLAMLVQRRTARAAVQGGAAGLGGGALVALIVGDRLAAIGAGSPGAPLLGVGGWLLLAVVPLALAGGATLATRLAVLATLRRAP